uniref:Uncharacterized protein n=1 Tax=Timema shepardi TaxID=629360 RepID=A0A7R9B6J7_TIMSH|nr:unnamed protein product [Timema shepardi]
MIKILLIYKIIHQSVNVWIMYIFKLSYTSLLYKIFVITIS